MFRSPGRRLRPQSPIGRPLSRSFSALRCLFGNHRRVVSLAGATDDRGCRKCPRYHNEKARRLGRASCCGHDGHTYGFGLHGREYPVSSPGNRHAFFSMKLAQPESIRTNAIAMTIFMIRSCSLPSAGTRSCRTRKRVRRIDQVATLRAPAHWPAAGAVVHSPDRHGAPPVPPHMAVWAPGPPSRAPFFRPGN
jgi:hypothetical protein